MFENHFWRVEKVLEVLNYGIWGELKGNFFNIKVNVRDIYEIWALLFCTVPHFFVEKIGNSRGAPRENTHLLISAVHGPLHWLCSSIFSCSLLLSIRLSVQAPCYGNIRPNLDFFNIYRHKGRVLTQFHLIPSSTKL